VQASDWCCMCSTFLQIQLIFSSPESYRLPFAVLHAYFVYMVWHCTSQHCSSMYACMYRLFASTWSPVVSVITTLCCDYFSLSSVASHAFPALCVYSKFGHHAHPLGYLCAKFCFFRNFHC